MTGEISHPKEQGRGKELTCRTAAREEFRGHDASHDWLQASLPALQACPRAHTLLTFCQWRPSGLRGPGHENTSCAGCKSIQRESLLGVQGVAHAVLEIISDGKSLQMTLFSMFEKSRTGWSPVS